MTKTFEKAKKIAQVLLMKIYVRNEMERKKRDEEMKKKAEELKKIEDERKREEEQRRREEQKKKEEEFRKKLEELKKLEEQRRKEENQKKLEAEQKKKEEDKKKALQQADEKKSILEQMTALLRCFQPNAVDEFTKNKEKYMNIEVKALRELYNQLYTKFMVTGMKQGQKRPAQSEGSDPKPKVKKPNEKPTTSTATSQSQQQDQPTVAQFIQMANQLKKNIDQFREGSANGASSQQELLQSEVIKNLVQSIKTIAAQKQPQASPQQRKGQGTPKTQSSAQKAQKSPRVRATQKQSSSVALPSAENIQQSSTKQVGPEVQSSLQKGAASLPSLSTQQQGGSTPKSISQSKTELKKATNLQVAQSQKSGNAKTPERSQVSHQQKSQGTPVTLQTNLAFQQFLQSAMNQASQAQPSQKTTTPLSSLPTVQQPTTPQAVQSQKDKKTETPERSQVAHQQKKQGTSNTPQGNIALQQFLQSATKQISSQTQPSPSLSTQQQPRSTPKSNSQPTTDQKAAANIQATQSQKDGNMKTPERSQISQQKIQGTSNTPSQGSLGMQQFFQSPAKQVAPQVQPSLQKATVSFPSLSTQQEPESMSKAVSQQRSDQMGFTIPQATQSQKDEGIKTPERSQVAHQQKIQGTPNTPSQGSFSHSQFVQQSPVKSTVQSSPQTPTFPSTMQQGISMNTSSQQRVNQGESSRQSGVQLMQHNITTVNNSQQQQAQSSQPLQRSQETPNSRQYSGNSAIPHMSQQTPKNQMPLTTPLNQQPQTSRVNPPVQHVQQQRTPTSVSHQRTPCIQQSPQYISNVQTTPVRSNQQIRQSPVNQGYPAIQSDQHQQMNQGTLNVQQVTHQGSISVQPIAQQFSNPHATRTVVQNQQAGTPHYYQTVQHSMQPQTVQYTPSQQQSGNQGAPTVQQIPYQSSFQQIPQQPSRIPTTPVKSNQQLGNSYSFQTQSPQVGTPTAQSGQSGFQQVFQYQNVQSSPQQFSANGSYTGIQQGTPPSSRSQTMLPVQSSPQHNVSFQYSTHQFPTNQTNMSMQSTQQVYRESNIQPSQGNQSFAQQQYTGNGRSVTHVQEVQNNTFNQQSMSNSRMTDNFQMGNAYSSPCTENFSAPNSRFPSLTEQPQTFAQNYSQSGQPCSMSGDVSMRLSQLNPLQRETFSIITSHLPASYNNPSTIDQILAAASSVHSLEHQRDVLNNMPFIPKNRI